MRKHILPLLFALTSCVGSTQPVEKSVTGYYPSWRWYERDKLVRPASIDYSKYNILIYAFLGLEADGSLSLTDPWADKNLLLGPINSAKAPAGYGQAMDLGNPAYHQRGARFSDYAHKHRVRFLASVGGWAHSVHFSAVAADPAKRARFAADCVKAVERYNLDGIDIDWEFPGTEERGGGPADRQNFTLLLQQVRQAFQAFKAKTRRDLMLTTACGASPKNLSNIDWPQVNRLLDAINLMAYSFYGHWDPVSNHNAPLFPAMNATQPGFSCVESVQNLLDLGVPSQKINLGLAFYGRTQLTTGMSGLHVSGLGLPDSIMFSRNAATPLYHEIASKIPLGYYDYMWDEAALVPYLSGKEGIPSFVSFDDENSIALKAHFAKTRNLRGVAIWDMTADYLESGPGSKTVAATPLASAIQRVFKSAESPPLVLSGTTVCVFPNPTANGFLQIFTAATERANTTLTIYDANGKQVHVTSYPTASHRVDIRGLPSGQYLVQVKYGNSNPVQVQVLKK
ncbi:MAG: glycosyl hydrolase family 18 protein [Saprospiraceae bacterium]